MVTALSKRPTSFDARSAFRIEPLEPRILLSATAATTGMPVLATPLASGLTELAVPVGFTDTAGGIGTDDGDNLFAGATELTPADAGASEAEATVAILEPAAIVSPAATDAGAD